VPLVADDDLNPWRSLKAVLLDVPPVLGQDVMARGGQSDGVRLLGSRDESHRRAAGDPQQLLRPSAGDLLGGDRCRGQCRVERDLIPTERHHVGRGGRREGSADDEAEVARADGGCEAGFGRFHQLIEDELRPRRSFGHGSAEAVTDGVEVDRWGHRPFANRRPKAAHGG
jgi:hypothetical protein